MAAPISKVVAVDNFGIDDLLEKIQSHRDYLQSSGELASRRLRNTKQELVSLVSDRVMEFILKKSRQRLHGGRFGGTYSIKGYGYLHRRR